MAYICDRCQKGILHGNKIGRARQGLNYRSPRIFKPNLHSFRGILNGQKGQWRLCTKCLRTVKKNQPQANSKKTDKEN